MLLVDANEGWRADDIAQQMAACVAAGVAVIEQPLPAADDAILADLPHPIPICADESVHGLHGLAALAGRYDAVNIKLDKTGGLTEALELVARRRGRWASSVMVGCMVGTSLAMAPAMLLTPGARFVDLDGPLLLARDREDGLRYEGSVVFAPAPAPVGLSQAELYWSGACRFGRRGRSVQEALHEALFREPFSMSPFP